ncbi:MAG: peroxiredoxin [Pseudomonadota bacterium]
MPLSAGQALPDVDLTAITPDGPAAKTKAELFGGKTIALFAVPGAFTPTCNLNHLPGYVTHADDILAKGADAIAVISVNDPFVMTEWKKSGDPDDKILFLADGSAAFTEAADMVLDASGFGMGKRSLRYAAVVDDGVVKSIAVEASPGEAEQSSASAMLGMLDNG